MFEVFREFFSLGFQQVRLLRGVVLGTQLVLGTTHSVHNTLQAVQLLQQTLLAVVEMVGIGCHGKLLFRQDVVVATETNSVAKHLAELIFQAIVAM